MVAINNRTYAAYSYRHVALMHNGSGDAAEVALKHLKENNCQNQRAKHLASVPRHGGTRGHWKIFGVPYLQWACFLVVDGILAGFCWI
jgi:hypothetical protein